jgi:hypothetical protein
MTEDTWELLQTCSNEIAAALVARTLSAGGVPNEMRADPAWLGAGRFCQIYVPKGLRRRAEETLAAASVTEEELAQLAAAHPSPDT